MLSDHGARIRVEPTGRSPSPARGADGLPYDVKVATQPSNPDQVCTVTHGAGTVGRADVTDVAVDCAPPATLAARPQLRRRRQGDDSRRRRQAEGGAAPTRTAASSRPAGARRWGTSTSRSCATTPRQSDANFGEGGIAKLDLGSATDEALDAALQPDGKIVVVGLTDGPGFNRNFAVVRLEADGDPDPGFDRRRRRDDRLRRPVDQANAVAVQPDGTIVVAGQPP